MRDFFPDGMRLQNWLFDKWRGVSRAFGFQEYEGPIFEFLDLYRIKSGEGIVSELFSFTDRGGREFAIRPEMTPTLARMVAARANALPRPIKWFSIPRMCRAEKPQRGRLREFFQWNLDVLGVDDPLADAEVIAAAVEFFRSVGLTAADVVVRVNDRSIATAMLEQAGVARDRMETAFQWIDRMDRLAPEDFAKAWDAEFGSVVSADGVRELLEAATLETCAAEARAHGGDAVQHAERLEALWGRLESLGVADFCAFDVKIVRGLAYYTGSVFEATARRGGLRALLGGGRYDNLTAMLDGPSVPGVGFGMGDVPVLECLRDLKRLPELSESIDVFVIDADRALFPDALALVGRLRAAGLSADFSYKRVGVGKQFKQAAARNARYAVVVGEEYAASRQVVVKDLNLGRQTTVASEALGNRPAETLANLRFDST
ncbi:MAG: histidine--tRNA ligase [Planctomycetota bacterium]|nr:MAG: histidine--tRNA ligase [Planctomycetota bacterium]